jgi:hypothetical protein
MTLTDEAPRVNVPLLRKTLEHIEAHPQEWDQAHWHCGTGMCFAGTACDLDGGEWVPGRPVLVQRDGEPDDLRYRRGIGRGEVHACTRAMRILGLTPIAALALFSAGNTLADLRRQVTALCEHGL